MKRIAVIVIFLAAFLSTVPAAAAEPQSEPKQEEKSNAQKAWEAVKYMPLEDVVRMPFKITTFLSGLWLFKRPDWSGLHRGREAPPCQPVTGQFPGGDFRADQCQ